MCGEGMKQCFIYGVTIPEGLGGITAYHYKTDDSNSFLIYRLDRVTLARFILPKFMSNHEVQHLFEFTGVVACRV